MIFKYKRVMYGGLASLRVILLPCRKRREATVSCTSSQEGRKRQLKQGTRHLQTECGVSCYLLHTSCVWFSLSNDLW